MRGCGLEQNRLAGARLGDIELLFLCREIEMEVPEHIHTDNHIRAEAVTFVIHMFRPAAKRGPVIAATGLKRLDDDKGIGDGYTLERKLGEAAGILLRVGIIFESSWRC